MLPSVQDPVWIKIIKAESAPESARLASRLAVSRQRWKFCLDPALLPECIVQLHEFFMKNDMMRKDIGLF
jgi:hypothetical protein